MKKKVLSLIAAAAFAVGVGGTNSGCVTAFEQARVNSAIENRERSLKNDLEEIAKSVHCVRQTVEYRKDGAPATDPAETKVWYGTAFAYTKKDGYTFLVTNNHVIDSPAAIPVLKITGGAISLDMYVKAGEKIELVDDKDDKKKDDDVLVEKVFSEKVPDVGIVRTRSNLHVAASFIRDETIRPERWEDAYVVGFPAAKFKSGSRGMVSNPGYSWSGEGTVDVLDITVLGGNSGSPYFVRRGNTLYWAGIIEASMGGGGAALTLGVPLREFGANLAKYATSTAVVKGDGKK